MKTQAAVLFDGNIFVQEKRYNLPMITDLMSDEELAGFAKQNKEYFKFLFERYETKMKIYVRRITGAPNETIEDVVQEVFIKVYANIDRFDQSMKFSSWIYRIAHNQAINNYLYEKRRRAESIVYNEKGESKISIRDEHDIWKDLQQNNVNEKLMRALAGISEKYKRVIELNYFDGKTYKEIALELGKPVNTIGTMLNRGRKLLKKELIDMGVYCDVALVRMEKNFIFKG